MKTITPAATESSVDRNPSRGRRAVNRVVMLGLVIAGYLGLTATGANAQAADPTGGMFDSLQSTLTGTIIPAAALLIVAALVFGMAVKWVGKASKKS